MSTAPDPKPLVYPCRECACGVHRGSRPDKPYLECDGYAPRERDEVNVPCPCWCNAAPATGAGP